MKKFFITLIILLALGGTAFFFGWANFFVPPGSYGIITSKTHGLETELVQSGKFRWIWYNLIPTNAKIAIFSLDPVKYPIEYNSSLPSGSIYALFAGLGASDFSWELEGEISFSIKSESLIDIVSKNNIIDQDGLNKYIDETASGIKLTILNIFSNDMDSEMLENILSCGENSYLKQEVNSRFPQIKNFSFVIKTAKFPDFVLYRHVRLLYEDFLTQQREFVSNSLGRRAESHIESHLVFLDLERYGELLTKYPVLLEYLTLQWQKQSVTP